MRSFIVAAFLPYQNRTYLSYTRVYPQNSIDNTHYHLLARKLAELQQRGLPVITQSPSSSPYIWYLVENKIDPARAQAELTHYPPTEEGFIHVRSFENISFETINWDDIDARAAVQPVILVLKPTELSDDQRQNPRWQFLDQVIASNGEVLYEVWQVSGIPN